MIKHIVKPCLLYDVKNTIKMNVDKINNWENGAEIVQSIFNLWVSKGLDIGQIEQNFTDYYVQKARAGAIVQVITDETSKDRLVAELMNEIAELETEIKAYRVVTRKLYKKVFENECGYDTYIKENRKANC